MKAIVVVFTILIGIAAYSFFDQYLSLENNPVNSTQSASVSQTVKTKTQSNNPTNNPINNPVNNPTENKKPDVKISGLQATSYYSPSMITLSVQPKYGEKINMTGWKIKARKGEIIIPKGIEKYQSYRDSKDIILKDYAIIYIINDLNPLGKGKNFCLNKCFGYIKNYHKFYPSFYTYCPKPKLQDITELNPYCQEFILRLSNCEIPDYSNNMKISLDSQCTSYLRDNFNYSACFKKYSNDEDFLKNYWYIYVGTDIVHELHDTVYLYDQTGLLVDKHTY